MLHTFILALSAALVAAQVNKQNSLTPDAYWHNRYHAILSMAAYGDYNASCPVETFTEAAKLKNFPNSTYPPWDVLGTFGPTPSGAEGFYAIVPEMNKALIIFKGNYSLEQNISTDVVGWDQLDESLAGVCNWFGHQNGFPDQNCTVNEFALQGYLEAKAETNNWQEIIDAYSGAGLVFSITGHGLGGMHSVIASVDLNHQNISYYSHSYGSPRTFNGPGAWYYNYNFWGESGERGISQNDQVTEIIPASDDYAHCGTPFFYSGFNNTALGPNWNICFDDDAGCQPQSVGTSNSIQDHYWYFTPVGQCGAEYRENLDIINDWLDNQGVNTRGFATGNNTGSSPEGATLAPTYVQPITPLTTLTTSSEDDYTTTQQYYAPTTSSQDDYTPQYTTEQYYTTTRTYTTRQAQVTYTQEPETTRTRRTRTATMIQPTYQPDPTDDSNGGGGSNDGPTPA